VLRWALAIGRTPRELLASVDSQEITEMMAFDRLEPIGALHREFIGGQICAVLANAHRSDDGKAYAAADFMPALARAVRAHAPQVRVPKSAVEHDALIDGVLCFKRRKHRPATAAATGAGHG
jgi:hypothetical protein